MKDILWIGPWYRGHNNIRYAELLPRLARVDAWRFMLSTNRYLQAIQTRFYQRLIPGVLHLLARRHRHLWCTNLNLIPHFAGDIVVDMDDPRFTADEIGLLNNPHVCVAVTTTRFMAEVWRRQGIQKSVVVIPQGVDFGARDAAHQGEIAQQYRRAGDIVIGLAQPLMSAAPLGARPAVKTWPPEYNIQLLLDAMEDVWPVVPEAKLWLIGQPDSALVDRARVQPAIKLLGYIAHSALLDYVANFDIAVFARLADFQGRFNVKLLEYMGCGVPIVSTNVSESFLVTESGSGLVAEDVAGFGAALIHLCRDPELRHRLGESGRDFAADYDWADIAARYEREVFTPYFGLPVVK